MLIFKARRKDPTASHTLTASERRVMKILGTAMKKVRAGTAANEDQIIDALRHLPVSKVVDLVPDQPWFDAQADIEDELVKELVASGQRTGSSFPKIRKEVLSYRFDADRPEAAAWAKKESAKLVTEIIEDQRNTIRDFVSASQMGEFTMTQVARNLRDVVGLTTQQTGWVDNFRNRAISDRMALGDSFEQASARAAKETERYQERIHRYRSETIARTEILRANTEGRNQAWQQGIEEGFISAGASKKWSTEIDGRECEICTSLDGEIVLISEEFSEGDPPVHPNCRCDVLLVDFVDADLEGLTSEQLDSMIDDLLNQQESTPASSVGIQIMPDGLSGEDREAWLKNNVDSTLFDGLGDAATQQAYKDYSRHNFEDFNNVLRNGVNVDRFMDRVTDLRNGIMNAEPLKDDLRVWRGVKGGGEFAGALLDIPVGGRITDAGFMSTSASREIGFAFGGERGIVFEIDAPKGSHAIMGRYAQDESEIIFPPSSTVEIVSKRVEMRDGAEITVLAGRLIP